MENPIKLVNESANRFVDISSELWRCYEYPVGESTTTTIYIKEPCWLAVGVSGHRLLDAKGVSHYIPKGWIHLSWEARPGQPHFVK